MRSNHKFIYLIVCLLLGISVILSSCSDNGDRIDPVDLRYEVLDRYDIAAKDPQPVLFRVKSTKQWTVLSNNKDWCTIDPPLGDPNLDYDVRVQYNDNLGLDDRTDTLIIRSDYWIGKWVAIIQKGTAFLNVEKTEDLTIDEAGGRLKFTVKSNQNWTSKVAAGGEWVTILSGASGSMDGEIEFEAGENKGERREAKIEVLDRHGEIAQRVVVTQNGVILSVESVELRALYDDEQIVFNVESNTEWEVVKDDKQWYSFPKTNFEGNSSVTVLLEENPLTVIRSAAFELRTKSVEGSTPIVKRVILKQAHELVPIRHEFDEAEKPYWSFTGGNPIFNGDLVLKTGVRHMMYKAGLGTYTYKVHGMDAASFLRIFFLTGDIEIRCHLSAARGTTDFTTRPYSITNENPKGKSPFDKSVSNIIGLELSDNGEGALHVKWLLNGSIICEQTANEGGFQLSSNQKLDVVVDANPGNITLDWWEYTPLLEWD